MKGQISRDSYRPDERYAGVFHIQGGMVTDADLDERTRIVTARTRFEGRRARIDYPNGNPRCLVCGTCKRDRVLAHRAVGRRVVFIGDGESDRYAAGYSDVVFAKRSLVRICVEAGWPFERWTEFREIEAWLATTIAAWEADPSSLARLPPDAPPPRGFFCGEQVWGEGRIDPPPGHWPPPATAAEREG